MFHAIRPQIVRFAFLGVGLAVASAIVFSATAQDLTRRAIPRKWIDSLVPEDLPTLELKEYVKSDVLEKARAEASSGRYKLSLLTLAQAKNVDPVELALAKAKKSMTKEKPSKKGIPTGILKENMAFNTFFNSF